MYTFLPLPQIEMHHALVVSIVYWLSKTLLVWANQHKRINPILFHRHAAALLSNCRDKEQRTQQRDDKSQFISGCSLKCHTKGFLLFLLQAKLCFRWDSCRVKPVYSIKPITWRTYCLHVAPQTPSWETNTVDSCKEKYENTKRYVWPRFPGARQFDVSQYLPL